MPEKNKKSKKAKKKTWAKTKENYSRKRNVKQYSNNEKKDRIKQEQKNYKKETLPMKTNFPLNVKAWDDSLSDSATTPALVNETNNSADEKKAIDNKTVNEQSKGKQKESGACGKIQSLETKNAGHQVRDLEVRHRLGKSALHAWSSITDVDTLTNADECQREAIFASKVSVDDRIPRRLKEKRLMPMAVVNNKGINNSSFIPKPTNTQDEITVADTESGFPTYLSEVGDSAESIDSATSSISIPIPAFGESTIIESNTVMDTTDQEEHGFMRLLTWCCLPLRSYPDSHDWSCRGKFSKSCEGDHQTKACP